MADLKFSEMNGLGLSENLSLDFDFIPAVKDDGYGNFSNIVVTLRNIIDSINAEPINPIFIKQCIPMACSDETTDLTTGLKITFRMPYAMTLTEVRASFTTVSLYPSIIDIHCNGVSIFTLGNLLTIDPEEYSSVTGTPYAFNDNYLPDNSEIEVYLTDIGAGTPKGLKVYIDLS